MTSNLIMAAAALVMTGTNGLSSRLKEFMEDAPDDWRDKYPFSEELDDFI